MTCPAQAAELVKHFSAKGRMDIDGFGGKLIEALFAAGKIRGATDIYRLTAEDIATLPRQGMKSARKVIAAIEASKKNDAVSIPGKHGASVR